MHSRPQYGNWVPRKLMSLLWVLTAILLILRLLWVLLWPPSVLSTLLSLLTVAVVFYTLYMQLMSREFSFEGGGLMGRIHRYMVKKLPWDGRGTLLDIGCGSGALTIRCAKKFPSGAFVGLDYWGSTWDYAKAICEENARIEGVDEIEFIKGDARALPYEDDSFDAVVSNFVFHEIRSVPDKRDLVREALRVVKPGGVFAFHDLFECKRLYGNMNEFIAQLKKEGIRDIHYESHTERLPFVPACARTPMMLMNLGLLYGRK